MGGGWELCLTWQQEPHACWLMPRHRGWVGGRAGVGGSWPAQGPHGGVFPKETWYWDASNVTEMVLSGVKCTGQEMALSHCRHHDTVSCQKTGTRFAAGVICSESEL